MFLSVSLSQLNKKTGNTSPDGAYDNYKPGIGVKFLRDGVPSGNVVAMFSTEGQHSWNFFKHDFSNGFPIYHGAPTLVKALRTKFSTVTNYISSVGSLDMAKYKENGEVEANPKFPFRIIFRPTSAVNTTFSDEFTETYTTQLKKIPSGTTVYDLYAIDEPGCNEVKIGAFKLNTQMITSHFADEKLFFRHGLIDEDDKFKPGFTAYRDSFSVFGGITDAKKAAPKTGCPIKRMFQ